MPDIYSLVLVVCLLLVLVLRRGEQRQRIRLLAQSLHDLRLEQTMTELNQGYQRALGSDEERQRQIWQLLRPAEQRLASAVQKLAERFEKLPLKQRYVTTLPIALPGATSWLPGSRFDMHQLLQVHANSLAQAVRDEDGDPKARAHRILADILLLQHSCHWYCRSRGMADARLLAHQQTSHMQVCASVAPATRSAYANVTRLSTL